jgi:uncharacterized protein (DUF427 family)
MARSEAYDRHPEHVLRFEDTPAAVRIRVGEHVLAETRRGLTLLEGRYPAVVYVPREDVRMERLRRVDHSTHCPFKGDATYFDFGDHAQEGPASVAQVAWSYEDPFDQMETIRGHLAFYADRAIIETLEE